MMLRRNTTGADRLERGDRAKRARFASGVESGETAHEIALLGNRDFGIEFHELTFVGRMGVPTPSLDGEIIHDFAHAVLQVGASSRCDAEPHQLHVQSETLFEVANDDEQGQQQQRDEDSGDVQP